ncbi:uncharacterized protein A4U43_C04F430 [Asparagus officinalis]|uniref:Protein ApaG n=1 Tax=Asparagus officinalis TaxID=4686 RepID=A0A5P1EXN9_ASPOF|nr:uncharacterized protein LOC109836302 [Asparagus officinalis]ONK70682.1 uncharacterized protein A4U43_C04F430 [Asparagus officinalis]
MEALGLKMVGGLKPAVERPSPWPWPWPNRSRRTLGILACSSSSSSNPNSNPNSSSSSSEKAKDSPLSSSSFLSRSQTYALLKQQMAVAAKLEDYKEAARIRDSLKSFEAEEPVLRLRGLMKKAVEEEKFEDAARYRDQLKILAPHAFLRCSSDAVTLGIRVQVRSVYIEGRSLPSKGQYFFAYRIRITNNSQRPVQLLRRHWIITDGNGKTENIWGVGVIGEQPVILPKTGFEYSSACPLSTPNGRMEGDFEMKHIDKVGSPTFNVSIAPFSLSIIGDDDANGLI